MNLRPTRHLLVLFFAISLAACSGNSGKKDSEANCSTGHAVPGFDLNLSGELSCKQRTSIEYALKLIDGHSLHISNEVLAKGLGGKHTANIRSYLNQRIKYIGGDALLDEADRSKPSPTTSAGVTVAVNIGIQLWIESFASFRSPGTVRLQGHDFKLNSGRVGIIALGDGFNMQGRSDFNRLITLLHEARHSDCSSGLDEGDLKLVTERDFDGLQNKNPSCGHLHEVCPAGHQLAGTPACDSHAWGAYSMSWMFAQNFADNCMGCSEKETQTLLIAAKDSLTRVLSPSLNTEDALNMGDNPNLRTNPQQN